MPLAIRAQFIAGYSGREWPPSPARLFKALVASARAGWALAHRTAIDDSLRVLERQGWVDGTKFPEIIAPPANLRAPRQRRFIPNNSKNWPPERKLNPEKGIDLEPEPMVRWDIGAPRTIGDVDTPRPVWYWWPNMDTCHVPVLREVARRVVSVGKGEDFAVLDATDREPSGGGVRWKPGASGASLEVPEAGCLDVCDALFARNFDDLPLPAAGVRTVTYASDAPPALQPVPTYVLALWRGGRRCSWDARLLRQVVGPIRHLLDEIRDEIVDLLAKSSTERHATEALARRVLLGHDDNGNYVPEPHLAVLPLPSVLGPYPDGRIRRVALVGFGCAEDPHRRAIVDLAQVLLQGRELRDNGLATGVFVRAEPDDQWRSTITQRSRTWATVTPIVQAAKELTALEWQRLVEARRNADREPAKVAARELHLYRRRLELIERSVRHAIDEQDARIEAIEFAQAPFIAGPHLASQYRVHGYLEETPRLHLRVSFDREVAGPLAIGRGRYVGFGLLWPIESAQEYDE